MKVGDAGSISQWHTPMQEWKVSKGLHDTTDGKSNGERQRERKLGGIKVSGVCGSRHWAAEGNQRRIGITTAATGVSVLRSLGYGTMQLLLFRL